MTLEVTARLNCCFHKQIQCLRGVNDSTWNDVKADGLAGVTGVRRFLRWVCVFFLKGPLGASRSSRPIGSEHFSRWSAAEFEFPASF